MYNAWCSSRIYIKVKFSRYRPGVAQRVGRGIALLFHDRGTGRGWVVSSTPRPHFTPGKGPVPILQEAGWALVPVFIGGSRTVQPVVSRYTDWATRPIYVYVYTYTYTYTYTCIYIHIHIHTYIYVSICLCDDHHALYIQYMSQPALCYVEHIYIHTHISLYHGRQATKTLDVLYSVCWDAWKNIRPLHKCLNLYQRQVKPVWNILT